MDTVTEDILKIERQFWRTAGAKENAIRALGLSPTRYYQLLNQMVASQAMLAAEPVLTYRLRRIARHP